MTKGEKIKETKYKKFLAELTARNISITDLIDYYTTHTIFNTAEQFNLASTTVKALLEKNNIQLHTKQENAKLAKQQRDKTKLEKYGDFCLGGGD